MKNFDSNQIEMKTLETSQKLVKLKQMNLISSLQNLSYMESGLIEIYLIDNFKTVQIKTIPVKPNSKCKEVNSLIASKFKIFNCFFLRLKFRNPTCRNTPIVLDLHELHADPNPAVDAVFTKICQLS